MQKFAVRTVVNGVALWLAAVALPGIRLGEEADALGNRVLTIILVAVIFGVVNSLLRPIATFFSFPLIILTLGLFTLILNALMLEVTAALSGAFGLDFYVDDFFWSAVIGALIISVVSLMLNVLLPDERHRRRL